MADLDIRMENCSRQSKDRNSKTGTSLAWPRARKKVKVESELDRGGEMMSEM